MQSEISDATDIDGIKFGRYVPLKLLGKGAMGKVYLSLDPVLQRSVAVKVISIDEKIDETTRTAFLERFSLEARASARLSHQSIVTVYDAGEQNGFPWIAFEFVEGESLEDLLIREKQIPSERIKSILSDIASALKHAHEAGIVHRDVKPANILIEKKTGIAKLSDFGVIKAPFSMATQEGMTLGSPGYMSPEQIDGTGVDQRSDLFSLGIIYYQMVSGHHPFLRDTLQSTLYATLMGEYTPLSQVRPDIDKNTEQLITRLLKVNRDDRVKDADEFLQLIANASSSGIGSDSAMFAQKLFKTTSAIAKTVQPVWNMIKKTDDVILSTARNPKVQSFIKKSTTAIQRAVTKMVVVIKMIPVRNIIDNKKRRGISLVSAGIVLASIAGFSVYQNYFSLTKTEKTVLAELAQDDGFRGSPRQLVTLCKNMIDKNELNDAAEIADALKKIRKQAAQAYVLSAIIELKDDDGDDAVDAVDEGKRLKGFNDEFDKERARFIDALREYLSDDEIDRKVVDCVVYTLHLGKNHTIRKWPYDRQYWLRWNSIRIHNEVGLKVDMVEVYILDLKYASSMRVRIRAANKLAEMKDKRAISALKEVAQRGFSDPIVSVAAQSALDELQK